MLGYKELLCIGLVSVTITDLFCEVVQNYDSGRIRVGQIISNEQTGVVAHEKDIKKAEVLTIAQDLNTAAIADFFGCKTVIGNTFLQETLASPISPEDTLAVLEKRQNAIKALVENPDLKAEVEQLLEIAKEEEQEVIQLMSEFFIGQNCPDLQQLELMKKQNPYFYPWMKFITMDPMAKTIATVSGVVSTASCLAATGFFAYLAYMSRGYMLGMSSTKLAFNTAYFGALGGMSTYALSKDYATALEKRTKMHSLNQLITVAEKLEKLCNTYEIANQYSISDIKDPNGTELLKGLKNSRYKDKKMFFFLYPLVHTFLYRVYEQEKHLAEVLMSIAEMDAYNAIANKIIESKNEKNKFCFVAFVENDKPFINAQNFWNVLVKNAVPADLCESKHIILTGPNAGGKTTTIRAVLQNIVLGQTFGVAAAESLHMTQFDVIYSYMNISDDILNGLSLFASEVKRAQEIVQKIKALPPHKKFFFALDELFTGTVAEDGEVCAYEFVKRISHFEGVQFIYSTHFNKLKELGNDNERCINYKVDAPIKNNHNKLVYPYTLSKGASESRVALDLAREAELFA